MLTVPDLLDGKRIDMATITGSNATFKKATKYSGEGTAEKQIPLTERDED